MQIRSNHSPVRDMIDLKNGLRAKLQTVPISKILILGIGNTLKADDGIGPAVCEALKPMLAEQVIDGGTAPENYLHKILDFNPQCLLMIDAMDFGAPPGRIRLFEPDDLHGSLSSTHALNPRTFTDLITGQCNTTILYIGIQPGDRTLGNPMSPILKSSVRECVRSIAAALGKDMRDIPVP